MLSQCSVMVDPCKSCFLSSEIPGIPWSSRWNPLFFKSRLRYQNPSLERVPIEHLPPLAGVRVSCHVCWDDWHQPMVARNWKIKWIPTDQMTKWPWRCTDQMNIPTFKRRIHEILWDAGFLHANVTHPRWTLTIVHVTCSMMQWCPVRWSSPLVLERLQEHLLDTLPFKLPGRSATHLGSLLA